MPTFPKEPMSRQPGLYSWIEIVSTHFPHLRGPQAQVLALWSLGTALVGTCGRTTVASFLALLLGHQPMAVEQQLREWYCEASAKKGAHRQTFSVETCFGPLLAWVLSLWPPHESRLALALDATTLGQRFTVLAVCLLYRGTALPIAWVVLPAATPSSWKKHWLALLHHLQGRIPAHWTVVVMADRGLYAPWLFRTLRRYGWHPFLRINPQGYYRPTGARLWQPLPSVVPHPGTQWCGLIHCFRQRSVRGTLLARWESGSAEPWLILTDFAPEQAEVGWYALRAWIESSFKTAKRGAWQWQATRMEDPGRASRVWLVLALATLWTVSLGGAAEAATPASHLAELPPTHIARCRWSGGPPPRRLSCVKQGRLLLLARLLRQASLHLDGLVPTPWPIFPLAPPPTLETYP